MSTRQGGVSAGPFSSLNLGDHVGDDPDAVRINRLRLAETIGACPVFLTQVHGTAVVRVGRAEAERGEIPQADAAFTTEAGVACTVMVADCLPVLLASRDGRGVAAAHAGWRGLCHGVLENTVFALGTAIGSEPAGLVAWLGACIGPRQFEVGDEVREAFMAGSVEAGCCFTARPGLPGKWLADLPELARQRLSALGVRQIVSAQACTVEESSRFFSFRRDGVTGRMAAAIWREDGRP